MKWIFTLERTGWDFKYCCRGKLLLISFCLLFGLAGSINSYVELQCNSVRLQAVLSSQHRQFFDTDWHPETRSRMARQESCLLKQWVSWNKQSSFASAGLFCSWNNAGHLHRLNEVSVLQSLLEVCVSLWAPADKANVIRAEVMEKIREGKWGLNQIFKLLW